MHRQSENVSSSEANNRSNDVTDEYAVVMKTKGEWELFVHQSSWKNVFRYNIITGVCPYVCMKI